MGRRGNPYDNPKAESFMKTLKVEAVYPMAYETFADVADDLPKIHRQGLQRSSSPLSAGLSQPATVRGSQSPVDGQISRLILVRPKGPNPPFLLETDTTLKALAVVAARIAFETKIADTAPKGRTFAEKHAETVGHTLEAPPEERRPASIRPRAA